jgi:hypothetical protein
VIGWGKRLTSQHHNRSTPEKDRQASTAQEDVWNPEPGLDSLEKDKSVGPATNSKTVHTSNEKPTNYSDSINLTPTP